MATFLVLTPPGAGARAENARFLRDHFSWFAFLLPAVWLLAQRAWFAALLAVAVQGLGLALANHPALGAVGLAIALGTGLLVALEGPSLLATALERKGWTLDTVISAEDRAMAEEIYYSEPEAARGEPRPALPAAGTSRRQHEPMLGLVGFQEGR